MEILLTIGIPTWNRAVTLERNIKRLVALIHALPSDVADSIEVLVSDNASTDNTCEICKAIQLENSRLVRISRNAENIGFSRNVDALFRNGNGKYVLVLSDDDSLEDDAIEILVEELKNHPSANCAYLQSMPYNDDWTVCLRPDRLQYQREQFPRSSAAVFFDDIRAFYRYRKSLTNVCISGCVFNRHDWTNQILDIGLQSGSIQLYAALTLQNLGGGVICVERPTVRYNAGEVSEEYICNRGGGWESGYPFVYHFDSIKALVACKKLYPLDIYRSFYRVIIRGLIVTIIDAKKRHWPYNQNYVRTHSTQDLDPDYLSFLQRAIPWFSELESFPFTIVDRFYKVARNWYYSLIHR